MSDSTNDLPANPHRPTGHRHVVHCRSEVHTVEGFGELQWHVDRAWTTWRSLPMMAMVTPST
eukprot:2324943-Pyramimonas_sp.AAC.1